METEEEGKTNGEKGSGRKGLFSMTFIVTPDSAAMICLGSSPG